MARIEIGGLSAAESSILFHMDGGGRQLIDSEIDDLLERLPDRVNVLEIGCFLGHSTRRWLERSERIHVIVCDLFTTKSGLFHKYVREQRPWACQQLAAYTDEQLVNFYSEMDAANGHLRCFIANVLDFRDRLTVYEGTFQENARELFSRERVDLIFLDAEKSESLFNLVVNTFPAAVLTGDDWHWGAEQGFPMQKAVKGYCEKTGKKYVAKKASWVIKD